MNQEKESKNRKEARKRKREGGREGNDKRPLQVHYQDFEKTVLPLLLAAFWVSQTHQSWRSVFACSKETDYSHHSQAWPFTGAKNLKHRAPNSDSSK